MNENRNEWLGDLRWQGYPHLSSAPFVPAPPPAPTTAPENDQRLAELTRENEELRARVAELRRLAAEFERRLSEAGAACERAALDAESRLRDLALELKLDRERRGGRPSGETR